MNRLFFEFVEFLGFVVFIELVAGNAENAGAWSETRKSEKGEKGETGGKCGKCGKGKTLFFIGEAKQNHFFSLRSLRLCGDYFICRPLRSRAQRRRGVDP
ncbi:hypothetical protein [Desulfosarcina variabilis]|uniref:hypothetical protein n=1 Tax=Desulfosarcina variabilis TaxID=2300 RepID=UPI003AFA3793